MVIIYQTLLFWSVLVVCGQEKLTVPLGTALKNFSLEPLISAQIVGNRNTAVLEYTFF
jgi:hypothetical protein